MEKQEILRKLDEIKALLTEEQEQEETRPEFINDLYSWDELQSIAQSGKATEKIAIGDRLEVYRNGKQIIFDVVKITPNKIYLMTHYLIAQMPFDAPEPKNPNADIARYGSNNYLGSSIRQWLNSSGLHGDWWEPKAEYDTPIGSKDFLDGFAFEMDTDFLDILECDENGDKFFLPSEDEIKEWFPNEKDRIKSYASGEKDWYWTRTPYSGYSDGVRTVGTSGALDGDFACTSYGVAPACIIGNL